MPQRRVEHPTVAAVVDTDTSGRGPKLFRHDQNRAAGALRYLGEAALPAAVRIGKSHRLGEELVFGASKTQLDPHASLEARFGKQQVAPAKTEIAGAGPDLVERRADTCRCCLDL